MSLENFQSLCCPHCGAPLPAEDILGDTIVCEYCGVPQLRIDVEKYIEQLRAEVFGWVRSMVPTGIQGAGQVDSVARSQIFEQSIRQGISGKLTSMNMQLIKIGSGALLVPPYASVSPGFRQALSLDSKMMLAEAAKFQGLSSFAQTEEQVAFTLGAINSAETLGYLANIVQISSQPNQRSYRTIAKNFESAADSLNKEASRIAGGQRMLGLAAISSGIAALLEGKLDEADKKLAEAEVHLDNASTLVMKQASTIAWFPGIKAERTLLEGIVSLVEGVRAAQSYGLSYLQVLDSFGRYVSMFEVARKRTGKAIFVGDHLDPDSFREVCNSYRSINQAKAGSGTVTRLLGSGRIWVACWLADVSYSFETGVLFMKKGQAMQEKLLVSGTFPLFPEKLSSSPEDLVTDVFSSQMVSSMIDRIKGNERMLTTGLGFSYLASPVASGIPASMPVVPPLCTKVEAEKLANIYLERVRQRLSGKLRVGIPSITKLIYVAGDIREGRLSVTGLPVSLYPFVGGEGGLLTFAL